MIEHGEQVLDVLGSEVDRIEKEIKVGPMLFLTKTLDQNLISGNCFSPGLMF